VWLVKLRNASLTCVIPEHLRNEQLIIKRYTNKVYFALLLNRLAVLMMPVVIRFDFCLQCFDAVGWAAGWASGL